MTEQTAVLHQIPRRVRYTDPRRDRGELSKTHDSRNAEMNRKQDALTTNTRDPLCHCTGIERHLCRHRLHEWLLLSQVSQQQVVGNRRMSLGVGGNADLVEAMSDLPHRPNQRESVR